MTDRSNPCRVLVVEDEYYIADDLVRALRANGLAIVGPVASQSAALGELDRHAVDFAVIDINLDGAISFNLAAVLQARDIPFMFLTGYDPSVLPEAFRSVLLLQKPYDHDAVLGEIAHRLAPEKHQ